MSNNLMMTQAPYSPALRRRVKTILGNFVINPFPQKMPLEQSQEMIQKTYGKLSTLISFLDTLIENRLQKQQQQLILVMKHEIDQMKDDIKQLIIKYNYMIEQKNKDEELDKAIKQLEEYKRKELKLFQENKMLIEENKRLSSIIRNHKLDLQNTQMTLAHITKKYMKQKKKGQKILHERYETEDRQQLEKKYFSTKNKANYRVHSNSKFRYTTQDSFNKCQITRRHNFTHSDKKNVIVRIKSSFQ